MPRWAINLLLVTGSAALTLLTAYFTLTLVTVGLLPEPDYSFLWFSIRIVLLSMGPGLVLFVTRKREGWHVSGNRITG